MASATAFGILDMESLLPRLPLHGGRAAACAGARTVAPRAGSTLASEYAPLLARSTSTGLPPRSSQQRFFAFCVDDDIHIGTITDIHDGLNALVQPDRNSIAESLRKCIARVHVQRHHYCIVVADLEQDTHLANLLVTLYARIGDLRDSKAVFEGTLVRTVVTWTAIITFFAREGFIADALFSYRRMLMEGTPPNNVTLIGLLGSFMSKDCLIEGRRIHASCEKDQLFDVILSTSLITMYGRCGCAQDARLLFDRLPKANLITWNALITIYIDHDYCEEALSVFYQMQSVGMDSNESTYINSFKACGLLNDIAQSRVIHSCAIEQGWVSDLAVCNSLLNMYGKCGAVDEALCVFEKMSRCDVITWNVIISTYTHQGRGVEGIELYRNMQQQGLVPEKVTFISAIGACASVAGLEEGKFIHACLVNYRMEIGLQVGNGLIHMYGRCGALDLALAVFNKITPHNVVSWTAIIAAFSHQGHAKASLQLFNAMQKDCVKPDELTYLAVLSACSHAGLLEEGLLCFAAMEKEYDLTPNADHYVCMIDLFGRAGRLSEAEFICNLPFWHDGCFWAALLGSCTLHSDSCRGKYAAEQTISVDPATTAAYVLLGNLHAADYRERCPKRIRRILETMVALCIEIGD